MSGRRQGIQIKNAIINNNTRINCISRTHNCKRTFANSYVYILSWLQLQKWLANGR